MPPLNVLLKPVSSMCNMNCCYCFYDDETQKRTQASYGFMSEETLKNIIRKTLPCAEGFISYVFQGGEPTLRGLDFFQNVISLQKQYNRNNIAIYNSLQTNGYAIDSSWCHFFKKNNFLLGISIDGTKEIHDSFRRTKSDEPTYSKISKTVRIFDKYQVDYNILTVVTHKSASHIRKIYAHYKKMNWKYQQYIACLDPLDEIPGQAPYSLQPKEYGYFLVQLFDLWYEDWKQKTQPQIRQFENYIGILLGYLPESCNQRGTCSMQLVVEADGSVYPCDFYALDAYKLGNFNEDRLENIATTCKNIAFVERSLLLEDTCLQCPYFFICRGGCQRNRIQNKQTGKYHNYFCQSYKMFFDSCLSRLQEIASSISHTP